MDILSRIPLEALQFGFMRRALVGVLLVSPALSMLGCMVVETRMSFFADSVAHAGLAGIALGAILGWSDPWLAVVVFSVLLALAVALLPRWASVSGDAVIGIVQSFSVALGVVLLSRGGGFARWSSVLVGDFLSVTPRELWFMSQAMFAFLVLWIRLFNRILLASLFPSLAQSRRIAIFPTRVVFTILVALVVALSIRWVGILVIGALLVLPASTARNLAGSMASCTWLALGIGLVCGVSGLFASYSWSTATGGTIVLFAMGAFLASLPLRALRGSPCVSCSPTPCRSASTAIPVRRILDSDQDSDPDPSPSHPGAAGGWSRRGFLAVGAKSGQGDLVRIQGEPFGEILLLDVDGARRQVEDAVASVAMEVVVVAQLRPLVADRPVGQGHALDPF